MPDLERRINGLVSPLTYVSAPLAHWPTDVMLDCIESSSQFMDWLSVDFDTFSTRFTPVAVFDLGFEPLQSFFGNAQGSLLDDFFAVENLDVPLLDKPVFHYSVEGGMPEVYQRLRDFLDSLVEFDMQEFRDNHS